MKALDPVFQQLIDKSYLMPIKESKPEEKFKGAEWYREYHESWDDLQEKGTRRSVWF